MRPDYFVLRYGEIGIKGKNQPQFQKLLMHNIGIAVRGQEYDSIKLAFSKIILKLNDKSKIKDIEESLKHVFGVENLSQALSCSSNYSEIEKTAVDMASSEKSKTFRITSTRSWKGFPLDSMQLNKRLGAAVARLGKKVCLDKPGLNIEVNVLKERTFIFTKKMSGPGGLPVGCADRAISLLSGGIDSPVSSWLMMKRGCPLVLVHFYNENLGSPEKIKEIAKAVCRYQPTTRLYMVPFADCQKEIISKAPADYRMILYRRFMLRIANAIALKEKVNQIITGDSLGQVASQTFENMDVISKASDIPIYRPLISFDKKEIVSMAEKIGTYSLSIKPYPDCCSFMVPKHPVTKARIGMVESAEHKVDMNELIDNAIKKMEILNIPLE